MLVFYFAALLLTGPGPKPAPNWADVPSHWPPEVIASVKEYASQSEPYRLKAVPKRTPQAIRAKSAAERRELIEAAKAEALYEQLEVAGVTFPTPNLWDRRKLIGAIGGGPGFGTGRSFDGTGSTFTRPKVAQITGDTVFVKVHLTSERMVRGIVNVIETDQEETIVVKGVETQGFADGESFDTDEILICRGTKEYTTVFGGTRTLWTYERYPYLEQLREWERLRIHAYSEWPGRSSSK